MYSSLIVFITFGIVSELLIPANALPSPRKKRMIDGDISPIEEYPYSVALSSNYNSCGGALISPQHVLTAAHCVRKDDSPYSACVGAQLWCNTGSKVKVSRFIRHPEFHVTRNDNTENDIAVLLLEKPIELDATKQPVPMFEFAEVSEPGSIAVASGWGHWDNYKGSFSDLIRSARLEIIDKERCLEAYQEIDGLQPGEICTVALADRPRQSPCNGDSGGPLVIDGRIAGVMAHVENCTSEVYPNVFTEVAYFREWIDQAIKELSPPASENQLEPNVVAV